MSLQYVEAHYKATLTDEQFGDVETCITEMGEYLHKSWCQKNNSFLVVKFVSTLGDGPSCIFGRPHVMKSLCSWATHNLWNIQRDLDLMRILQARSFKDLRQVEPSLTSNLPGISYMHVILWNLQDFFPTVFYEDWFTVSTSLQIATLVYKGMPNTPYFESCNKFQGFFPR